MKQSKKAPEGCFFCVERGVPRPRRGGAMWASPPTDAHRRPFRTGNICRLLIAVFGKQGGGFLAVGPGVLADVLNGGLIQLALDPGG